MIIVLLFRIVIVDFDKLQLNSMCFLMQFEKHVQIYLKLIVKSNKTFYILLTTLV